MATSERAKRNRVILKFFHQGTGWINYDLPDTKIEVARFDDNLWRVRIEVAETIYIEKPGEIFEIAPHPVVAVTALLSRAGLPALVNQTPDNTASWYDVHPHIEYDWQLPNKTAFHRQTNLISKQSLMLNIRQMYTRQWIFGQAFYFIELIEKQDRWTASVVPRISEKETILRPTVTVSGQSREVALELLLKHEDTAFAMGLCYMHKLPVRKYFISIEIKWRLKPKDTVKKQIVKTSKPTPKASKPRGKFPKPKRVAHLGRPQSKVSRPSCSWSSMTKHCDGSRNCSFCASWGEGYFMRWDD